MMTCELLKRTEIFIRLTRTELEKVAVLCEECSFTQGAKIIKEGWPVSGIFIITYGEVKVVKGGSDIVTLGKGSLFGEMSFVDDDEASADVVVVSEEVDALKIDHNELKDLLNVNDRLAAKVYKRFLKIMSQRLRDANQKQTKLRAVQ